MAHKFLKKAGVKNEQEFYAKYPTDEAFFKDFPEMKNGGKLKGAWGASLGTDPYVGGPDPVNPFPKGLKIPKVDAYGNPIPDDGTIPAGTLPATWTNFPPINGATTPAPVNPGPAGIPMDPRQTGTALPNTGEGQLNRGKLPNLTEGQIQYDKQAIPPPKKNNKLEMPDGAKAGGMAGTAILAGLQIYSALQGPEKSRRRYVRPEDMQSYNPHQYGTGSQAINENGGKLKGKAKKAFWGALIGEAVQQGKKVAAGLRQNIGEAMAPILNIANNNAAEADRLNALATSGQLQDMSKLQPIPQIQTQYPQYPQYMKKGGKIGYNNGGELQTGEGGNTKLKSYNHFDGGTFQFDGASHGEGGIDISYKGQPAEVEGGETAFKDAQGDLKIMGNLKVPGTDMKYKTLSKKLSDKEAKAQKYIDKGTLLVNTANPQDPWEALSFNSGRAMAIGGLQKQKQIAAFKEHLGNMQEAHLELAKEKGKSPNKLFKNGGTIYKDGGTAGDPIYEAMVAAALKYGVNLEHLQRLVEQESNFSTKVRSSKGALGVMQFMPATAKKYGVDKILTSDKPEDVAKVVEAGVKHFKDLLDQNHGDYRLATAAYNGGQGAVDFVKKKTGNKDITGLEWMKFMEDRNIKSPTKDKNAWQTQTLDYVKNITGVEDIGKIGKKFREEYYAPTGEFTPYTPPDVKFPPNVKPPDVVKGNYDPLTFKQPAPYNKPSNVKGINPIQFAGEALALTDHVEPVKAQQYFPDLFQPYQVSFQDRLNENQATFNGIQKQLAYDPTAISTLAGQEYAADSNVLADEFRTNQAIANDITNKNVSLLNEAKKTNLSILDTQFVRQDTAKSKTRARKEDALMSISSKILQKEASNNMLKVYENLYPDYAFNKKTGKAEYYGPTAEENIDWSGVMPITGGGADRTKIETKKGDVKTTQYYDNSQDNFMKSLNIQKKQNELYTPKNLTYFLKNK